MEGGGKKEVGGKLLEVTPGNQRVVLQKCHLIVIVLPVSISWLSWFSFGLRCPLRTPEIAAISETRESNAALRFMDAMAIR